MTTTSKRGVWFPWLICGLGALFYCYEYFLRILPSVMTQDLMASFMIGPAAFGNLIAFYYYAYTPMQLPVGILMDRYGPRKLLVFACFICAFGTYLFAHHYLSIAQGGRFLVGLGSAFAFVGVLKLASLWLPPKRFAFIAGLATTLGMVGAMGGDIVLAVLVKDLGSKATLYLSAAVGLVLMICLWRMIPESQEKLSHGQSIQPMTYKQLFTEVLALCKKPQMWLIGFIGCLLYLSLSAFAEAWGFSYLVRAYGLSNAAAAANVSMVFLGWAVGGPIIGWLSDKFGNRRIPIILGAVLGGIIFSLIIYMPELAKPGLAVLLFLFGVCSSAEIIVFPIAREINTTALAGTAIAVTNLLVMLGGVFSQPLIGWFLDSLAGVHVKGNMMSISGHDFMYVLSVIPIGFILAAVLAFFVKETHGIPLGEKGRAKDSTKEPIQPAFQMAMRPET